MTITRLSVEGRGEVVDGGLGAGRALVGGVVAAVLWDVTRRLLTYYFTHLSLVNVVYGSLATVIVALVTMEVGSVILLVGAEVIAELEQNAALNLPWYGTLVDHTPAQVEALADAALLEDPEESAPEEEKPPDDSG